MPEMYHLKVRTDHDTFMDGLMYGYPVCCILDYIWDNQHDRFPATQRPTKRRRWSRLGYKWSGYVMCRRCAANLWGRVEPPVSCDKEGTVMGRSWWGPYEEW